MILFGRCGAGLTKHSAVWFVNHARMHILKASSADVYGEGKKEHSAEEADSDVHRT